MDSKNRVRLDDDGDFCFACITDEQSVEEHYKTLNATKDGRYVFKKF